MIHRKKVEKYDLFIDYFKLLLSNIDICYSTRANKEIYDTSVYVLMFVWITFVPRLPHENANFVQQGQFDGRSKNF